VRLAATLSPELKMKVLNEKYLLKLCAKGLIPDVVRERHKQPYRAPEGASFFGKTRRLDYVDELLQPEHLKRAGIFDPSAVQHLIRKFRDGHAIGVKDNMALVAILSSQLVVHQFIDRRGSYSASRIA
jgi:asparagine synthase (glutamine-hydrolysing)